MRSLFPPDGKKGWVGGWVGLVQWQGPRSCWPPSTSTTKPSVKTPKPLKTHLGEQDLIVRLQLERHDGGAGRPASRQLSQHLGHLFKIQTQRLIAGDLVLGLRRVRPSVCLSKILLISRRARDRDGAAVRQQTPGPYPVSPCAPRECNSLTQPPQGRRALRPHSRPVHAQ